MNNPLRILQTLDRHLTAPAELTLFGRAALALGYADIRFLLSRELLTADQLRAAFARARVPDIPETQTLFRAAQPAALALLEPD